MMILLSARDMSLVQVAGLLHDDPHTVRRWIGRRNLEGLTGLADRPRPGYPRLGSPQRASGAVRCRPPQSLDDSPSVAGAGPPRDQSARDVPTGPANRRPGGSPAGRIGGRGRRRNPPGPAGRVSAWRVPQGMRGVAPAPGSNLRRTLYGATNLATGP
ncbi:hypothetical protein GCM10012275_48200 [Longimycelium tulufanense]|uniref:Uncharacterized protein n=1 Tax=Longimycelium tulufanense TaxID=907463 RepID=A0A8J3CC06_9PSEU|nr:helix-turn-helix domain-containing protein [Longimycelium tulufanense]GGM72021.1 hypothetical protein GCM10012275_48200 [Longimycelium tulufanense]